MRGRQQADAAGGCSNRDGGIEVRGRGEAATHTSWVRIVAAREAAHH